MEKYMGNPSQVYGVEEHRLVGGKGDNMRLFQVRNGKGLEFTVSADRCADISRLSFRGYNFGFFAPCGYVAPQYYDNKEANFLKSFTAGFFTTCGFGNVGSPCNDDGEELPLHGNISNVPAEQISAWEDGKAIHIAAIIRDASLFGTKYTLKREYTCPLDENVIYLTDTVTNSGGEKVPFLMLYHCNMAYPLLCEQSHIRIDSKSIKARTQNAQDAIDDYLKMEEPQRGFEEQCFFFEMERGFAGIFNKQIGAGISVEFNPDELPCFTEWKMMGEGEYVLGLEPGNCFPTGRSEIKKEGRLGYLMPGESKTHHLTFRIHEEDF